MGFYAPQVGARQEISDNLGLLRRDSSFQVGLLTEIF
jgi:hypothetical protein